MNPVGQYEKTYLPGTLAGAGGLVSTTDDLLRWMKHMDAPVVGSPATWALMTTPRQLSNGVSTGYGCGLIRSDYRGAEVLSHDGAGMGASAQMLKMPAAGLDVVVIVNRNDVSAVELTERVLDACLDGLEPPVASLERTRPTGVFRSRTVPLVIEFKSTSETAFGHNGHLTASINGMDIAVEFSAENTLRPAAAAARWVPLAIEVLGAGPHRRALKLHDSGTTYELLPVERVKGMEGTSILGRYVCEGIKTEGRISGSAQELRLEFLGPFGTTHYKLSSLVADVWEATHIDIYPHKILLFFAEGRRSFGYIAQSTRYSPLCFRRCG